MIIIMVIVIYNYYDTVFVDNFLYIVLRNTCEACGYFVNWYNIHVKLKSVIHDQKMYFFMIRPMHTIMSS